MHRNLGKEKEEREDPSMLQAPDAPSNYPWTSQKHTGKYWHPLNAGLAIYFFSVFITQPQKGPGKNGSE